MVTRRVEVNDHMILEKAKPYTRVKRGKLEKVTGYVSRIAPNRSMQQYFKEVGEESLLTHDQTAKLARKYKKGDKAAGDQLVRANLKLVAKVANQYARYGIPVQDLIQEGNIGLMAAAKKYNPKKAKFSTYAWQWAEAYIRRYAKQRLEHIGVEGPLPGPEEKAQLVSKLATPEQAYQIKEEAQQRTAKIESAIQKLNPKEQFIIRSRILSEDTVTLEEISSRLDLSKQRISQMEKTALAKLKHYMGGDKMKAIITTIDEEFQKGRGKDLKPRKKRGGGKISHEEHVKQMQALTAQAMKRHHEIRAAKGNWRKDKQLQEITAKQHDILRKLGNKYVD